MIAFSDVDLLVVLAQTDLITEALDVLGVQNQDIVVTNTLFLRARSSGGRGLSNLGLTAAAKQRFVNLVTNSQTITESQNTSILAKLSDEGVDEGEAILFATACNDDDSVVVTGDKRALNDLAKIPDLSEQLEHRIVCLENLFLALFNNHGFNEIKDKVMIALETEACENKTLALCMQPHHTEEDARECMNSGINALVNPDLLTILN